MDELLPLVAIRFFLYRETADYHRHRAEQLLKELCAQQSINNNTSMLTQSYSFGKFSISPAMPTANNKRVSSNSLTEFSSHSPTSALFPTLGNVGLGSLRDQLETIMYEFQEAEANYTKASSHTNADYCSRKSQLVALQIAHINRSTPSDSTLANPGSATNISAQTTIPLILSMDSSQVREFIHQCNHFYEVNYSFCIWFTFDKFFLF